MIPEDFSADPREDQQYEERMLRRRKLMLRLFSLVLVFSFLLLTFSGVLRYFEMPSLDFLIESGRLSQNSQIAAYKEAVVAVGSNGHRGTGFAVSGGNQIVTNYHIIENADQIQIRTASRRQIPALSWFEKPQTDLALIETDSLDLPVLPLELEKLPEPGETVMIIGNPLGFFNIVNEAVFIGMSRLAGWDEPVLTIQGPVYKGNSGSPIINSEGSVIGVLFASSDQTGEDDQTVGFVIPAREIERLLEDFRLSESN